MNRAIRSIADKGVKEPKKAFKMGIEESIPDKKKRKMRQ